MDLVRHLEYFVAVAEERHFGRAAATLGVTQPPVSRAIKALEKHLGLTLVERTPDGAAITEHGAALLPRARLIVDDARRLTTTAESLTTSGTVRIGLIPQLDDRIAARIAASVGVQARVETAGAVSLLDGVRSHDLDVAVVDHPVVLDRLSAGPVIALPRRVRVPAGHRSARAERPRLTMLSNLAFATAPRTANPPAHDLILDAFRRHALDPEVFIANTVRDAAIGVASGRCFGLVPAASPVLPGTEHLDLAADDVALRVRIVRRDDSVKPLVDLIDRILLQACR
ncbi:LysR family transcriptional regulator [Rhodococcus sp. IEGM 1401]|uniref:LysR family transcriptional regulator n=1 Tax=unclassified Rhodococcus (in: high G+C Gram-positive bacteria) TaxID=192944 RepID=UPI0022B3D662|nr:MULTISPECIES: LysR family transcriptional regulator [unclassified Rhodococcus (in: high G+C Gram-positive bacteria)]MCZ4561149.1 LysR family transcriptional regulator [Rhodococcus sp. IEGM 1401]MDI9921214.1 LysR family transcriptional regulator [Rhodococcus sp. IEGM 1372]MDV8033667.1 LysR family transcriptional regulator [Rhodococcus sp. IEGM 1414]